MSEVVTPPAPPITSAAVTHCPECGEAYALPCCLAWADGAAGINSTPSREGAATGPSDQLTPAQLAKLSAPPAKARTTSAIIQGIVLGTLAGTGAVIASFQIADKYQDKTAPFVAFVVVGGVLYLIFFNRAWCFHAHNRDVYPGRYEAWRRRWVCLRCRHQWDPSDALGSETHGASSPLETMRHPPAAIAQGAQEQTESSVPPVIRSPLPPPPAPVRPATATTPPTNRGLRRVIGVSWNIICVIGVAFFLVRHFAPDYFASIFNIAPKASTITKQAWRANLAKSFNLTSEQMQQGPFNCTLSDFVLAVGSPDQIQVADASGTLNLTYDQFLSIAAFHNPKMTALSYQCMNGTLLVVCDPIYLTENKILRTGVIIDDPGIQNR